MSLASQVLQKEYRQFGINVSFDAVCKVKEASVCASSRCLAYAIQYSQRARDLICRSTTKGLGSGANMQRPTEMLASGRLKRNDINRLREITMSLWKVRFILSRLAPYSKSRQQSTSYPKVGF